MDAKLLDAALEYLGRGWSVFPVRGKLPADRWKPFQERRPTEAELRRTFERPDLTGLAVILGPVSDDLWCRDFDLAESFPRWAAAHADAAREIPRVRTARGHHLYAAWPAVQFAALSDGELRAGGGCYSVLPPSRHHDGPVYSWRIPPAEAIPKVDPAALELDRAWSDVTQRHPPGGDVTQNADFRMQSAEPRGIEETGKKAGHPEHPERTGGVPLSMLLCNIPDGPHHNHDALFHLARRIRGLEEQRGERYSMSDLQEAASAWCAANPHLRDGQTPDDYAIELRGAMGYVRVPYGGESTLDAAWQAAQTAPLVGEVAHFGEALARLACWCRELARVAGGRPFYLSARSVQERFTLAAPLSASRRLQFLCSLGVIELVERGDRRRASTFRYLLPL